MKRSILVNDMKKSLLATTLLILAFAVVMPKLSTASLIPLFYGGGDSGGTGVGEGRWTYFELLNDVTITQLGATLNPNAPDDMFKWEIYSTEDDVQDDPSIYVGALIESVFDTTFYANDIGFATYDTDVSVSLTAGFYALSLTFLDEGVRFGATNNIAASYPNPTIDGNFRVWGGASSTGGALPQVGNNGLLPQFSVNTEGFELTPIPDPIPAPSSVILGSIGLTFTGWLLHRRKTI